MNIMKFGPSKRRGRLASAKVPTPPSYFEAWTTKIEDFVSDVQLRLFRVEARLDHMDIRLDHIDMRLDHMDMRLDKIDMRLDKIDMRLDKIDMRLDKMDERFERLDVRLEQMTANFYKAINNLTLRLAAFVCGFGTTLVMATYFVVAHAK